ncbi:aspartic proteinase CDR1-like [Cornus florida]|uniref:aspartic proteinase CDR1-like n=1 Tax=Cornus florida TaxID=4283 RepID=UPI0028A096E3|nr:aspartic proteinase CDR1-like [Cornus florida]
MKVASAFVSFKLMILCSFIIVVSSSYNPAAIAMATPPHRLVTKLIHRDSVRSPYYNPNATTSDHARGAIESSMARYGYLKARKESYSFTTDDVRGDLLPEDHASALLVNLSIGEPPVPQLVAMDTGSTLLWVQCQPCRSCFNQYSPIFRPSKSSTYAYLPCESSYCDDPNVGYCGLGDDCVYGKVYGDGTTTEGQLGTEKLTFVTSDEGIISVPNVVFGCGHENKNSGIGKMSGVLGLGPYYVSLPYQFGSRLFSYCIGNIDDPHYNYHQLIIGEGAKIEGYSTPVTTYRGFYYVTLEGISLGEKRVNIDPTTFKRDSLGKGGVIIDSGSTWTFLAKDGFEPLSREVQELIGGVLEPVAPTDQDGRGHLCYKGILSRDLKGFPVVTFHFAGGADLGLDITSLFQQDGPDVFCMAVLGSDDEDRGTSVIGIRAQQYYNIAYDLNYMKLYFQRIDCELLED